MTSAYALISALTSGVWCSAPCRVSAVPDAMPSVMTSDLTSVSGAIWGHMGYGVFSFRGGHTQAFGIGWHTDTPHGEHIGPLGGIRVGLCGFLAANDAWERNSKTRRPRKCLPSLGNGLPRTYRKFTFLN
jgi:hypothetical protein